MFRHPDTSSCVLCGSSDNLTGEHKIKASALRYEFGEAHLAIGTHGADSPLRYAQSAKSKNLHFQARLCHECNTTRTQVADQAFERLHRHARRLYEEGKNIEDVLAESWMAPETADYVNVFTYFAKLLACQLADMGAPVQWEVCRFAIGTSQFNPINLALRHDHTFSVNSQEFPELQYAAHGGVVVMGNKYTHWPTTFYSTLTVGPLQYCFHARLNLWGQLRLLAEFPEFFRWCVQRMGKAAADPLGEEELLRLGLEK